MYSSTRERQAPYKNGQIQKSTHKIDTLQCFRRWSCDARCRFLIRYFYRAALATFSINKIKRGPLPPNNCHSDYHFVVVDPFKRISYTWKSLVRFLFKKSKQSSQSEWTVLKSPGFTANHIHSFIKVVKYSLLKSHDYEDHCTVAYCYQSTQSQPSMVINVFFY